MSMVFHEIIAWRWGKRKNAGLGGIFFALLDANDL